MQPLTAVTVTWHHRRQPQSWQCRNVTLRDSALELDAGDRKVIVPLREVRLIEVIRPEPDPEPEVGDDG